MPFQMRDLDRTKLPTKRNVVEFVMFQKEGSVEKRAAFTESVYEELVQLWLCAKIPILSRTMIRRMINDLLRKMSTQTKIGARQQIHAGEWDALFRISRCRCSIENDFPCTCADEQHTTVRMNMNSK